MNELAMLLDELVADAPVDKASWNDVLARTRTGRRRSHSRKGLVLALAGATLLAFATAAVGVGISLVSQQERFHANLPDDPQRIGPLVEITSGDDWALIAWKSEIGVCLDFAVPGNSPFRCGFPVRGATPATDSGAGPPIHAIAGFVSGGALVGGDGKTTIFGVAARDVAGVTVELRDGTVVDAALYDAPSKLDEQLRFFLVRLALSPHAPVRQSLPLPIYDPVRAYNAYDRDGRLIERVEDAS
jgi:hypothetical protein